MMKLRRILCTSFLLAAPLMADIHMLELNDGNRFLVSIAEEEISLSNGWKTFSVLPDALLDVHFDGGLYGTVCDRDGNKSELDFSFINGNHLKVKVLRSSQTFDIPWSEVSAIRKQEAATDEVKEDEEKISYLQHSLEGKYREISEALKNQKEVQQDLLSKMTSLEKEKEALESELAELKHFHSENEEQLSAQVEMLLSEMGSAKMHIENLSGELLLAQSRTDKKEVELQQLQQSLVEAKADAFEAEKLLSGLTSQLEIFVAKHELLANDQAELGSLIRTLKRELDLKEGEIVAFNEKVFELERENKAVQEMLSKSQNELEEKSIQIDGLIQTQENDDAIKKAFQEENAILSDALTRVEVEAGEAFGKVIELKDQLAKAEKKSEDFKKKMDQFFPEYDREKERGQQLQAQLAQLESALRIVEAKENRLTQENQQLLREKENLSRLLEKEQSRLKELRDLASRFSQSLQPQKSTSEGLEKSQLELGADPLIKQHYLPEKLISFKGIHIVAAGENLNNISMKYFNTPHRWSDIYEANQDVITDMNRLQVGTPLVIPNLRN